MIINQQIGGALDLESIVQATSSHTLGECQTYCSCDDHLRITVSWDVSAGVTNETYSMEVYGSWHSVDGSPSYSLLGTVDPIGHSAINGCTAVEKSAYDGTFRHCPDEGACDGGSLEDTKYFQHQLKLVRDSDSRIDSTWTAADDTQVDHDITVC